MVCFGLIVESVKEADEEDEKERVERYVERLRLDIVGTEDIDNSIS